MTKNPMRTIPPAFGRLIQFMALVMVFNPSWGQSQTPVSAPAQPYGGVHAPGYPRLILPGDYPDPSIMREGRDYYLTNSVFNYSPGFLIWHSTDLVHWRPLVYALKHDGPYAPSLSKVNGKYYIYYNSGGIFVITADNILGPWTEPKNIGGPSRYGDPGHAVGEDGKQYIIMSEGVLEPLSDDGLSVVGPAKSVYSGWRYPSKWVTEGYSLEGPKIFRRGDYFYLVTAEGGTAGPPTSHMVVVARSRSIHGPWENSPYNPVVHTYSADEQWWSKGHGTLIDDVNGNWWVVYHAYEKGLQTLGRQTLLDPIDWTQDGWPVLSQTAHPLPPGDGTIGGMTLSDDFSGPSLGLQWRAWRDFAGTQLRDGSLFLNAKGSSPADARLLLVTATDAAYEVQVEVTVPPGGIGGLVLFYKENAFAGLASDGKDFTLYQDAGQVWREPNHFGSHFFLKIVNWKNQCTFLASADGHTWTGLLGSVDVSGLQHNRFGEFMALRPALMAAGSGEVRFNRFIYKSENLTNGAPVFRVMVNAVPESARFHASEEYSAADNTLIKNGQTIFQQDCFACHGTDGKGTPIEGAAPGTMLAPPLAGSSMVNGPAPGMLSILLHGLAGPVHGKNYPGPMVPMAANGDEWIASVVSYVRNSLGNEASVVHPADVAAWRAAEQTRTQPWTMAEISRFVPQPLGDRKAWKVSASDYSVSAPLALDGNRATRYTTNAYQHPGQWYQVELPRAETLSGVVMNSGNNVYDFPAGYQVQVSADGRAWSNPIAQGIGSGHVTEVTFPPVRTRFIRITQTGSKRGLYWSMFDLELLQPPD